MVVTRLGRIRPLVAAAAATASGGEMIAPSTKASGQPNSGMKVCAIHATAHVVKITHPVASSVMGRFAFLKSTQEVVQAAAYKTGGRKTRNTMSGCKAICGKPG